MSKTKTKLTKSRVLREPKCPECEKTRAVRPEIQVIGEFVDCLVNEKKIILAHSHKHSDACHTLGFSKQKFRQEYASPLASQDEILEGRFYSPQCELAHGELYFAHEGIEELLAEFFGIDLKKRADEQDALLDYIRAKSEQDAERTDIKV